MASQFSREPVRVWLAVLWPTSGLAFSIFFHISNNMFKPVSAMFLMVCLNAQTTLSIINLKDCGGIAKNAGNGGEMLAHFC